MKVLSKYLLVKRVSEQKQTKSGLLLTGEDANEMRYHKAIVYKVGDNILGINSEDTILYDKVQSHEIILDNERMTIIQEKDVVCVFD
jgi:co-chaperonin GroES (HSP10)